jgi:hypothetical protein
MNTDQINSLIRSALKIVGALLLAHGLTNTANIINSPDVLGLCLTLAGLLASHWQHDANTPGPKTPLAALIILASSLALGTGCTSIINTPSGKAVSISERVLGLQIAQSTTTQTPEVKIGFVSSVIVFLPTSTNGPVAVPNVANSFDVGENGAFDTSVSENVASGNMATFEPAGTNSLPTTAPAIPK